jgi:hypothetical protein
MLTTKKIRFTIYQQKCYELKTLAAVYLES